MEHAIRAAILFLRAIKCSPLTEYSYVSDAPKKLIMSAPAEVLKSRSMKNATNAITNKNMEEKIKTEFEKFLSEAEPLTPFPPGTSEITKAIWRVGYTQGAMQGIEWLYRDQIKKGSIKP